MLQSGHCIFSTFICISIPDQTVSGAFTTGHNCGIPGIVLNKEVLIMVAFAILMVVSSYSMIKKQLNKTITDEEFNPAAIKFNYPMIIVGVLTGFVGAGGGS